MIGCPFCQTSHPAMEPDSDDLGTVPECSHWVSRFDPENYCMELGPVTDCDDDPLPARKSRDPVSADLLGWVFEDDLPIVTRVYGLTLEAGDLRELYEQVWSRHNLTAVTVSGMSATGWSYIDYFAPDARAFADDLNEMVEMLQAKFARLARAEQG